MRRFTSIVLAMAMTICSGIVGYADDKKAEQQQSPLNLSSKSAILMDVGSGQVLYEKNAHDKLPPASVTKVMTMLLVCEALDSGKITLNDNVQISENAASMGGSQIFLEPGEVQKVDTLLKGIAVASANDGCVAMAEYVAGSVESFVDMMNAKAKELGATHTHFVNPNGLHDDNHYTTAYDLYLIFKAACKYDTFQDIVSSKDYTMTYTNSAGMKVNEYMESTNYYLLNEYPLPEGVTMYGGKTGTTSLAKSCLIVMTKNKAGHRFFSVVLGAEDKDQLYRSMSKLLQKTVK